FGLGEIDSIPRGLGHRPDLISLPDYMRFEIRDLLPGLRNRHDILVNLRLRSLTAARNQVRPHPNPPHLGGNAKPLCCSPGAWKMLADVIRGIVPELSCQGLQAGKIFEVSESRFCWGF